MSRMADSTRKLWRAVRDGAPGANLNDLEARLAGVLTRGEIAIRLVGMKTKGYVRHEGGMRTGFYVVERPPTGESLSIGAPGPQGASEDAVRKARERARDGSAARLAPSPALVPTARLINSVFALARAAQQEGGPCA